jgi:flagellar protein FlaG|tara:strand:+ start:198 stop:593 length:396 start_codon:yes stop_codon:yes gene_type:complete
MTTAISGASTNISTAPAVPTPPTSAPQQASAEQPVHTAPKMPKVEPTKPLVDFDPKEMRQSLEQAISLLNEQLKNDGRTLSFRMDDSIHRPVITVRSTVSGEVIRQIPHEVVIRVAQNIDAIKGMLWDELG